MSRKTANLHFTGSLTRLLPADKRGGSFRIDFQGEQSVKHLFESCGVPHTEVGKVTANGEEAGPGYIVQDGDSIEVYPVNFPDPADFKNLKGISPPRFVLDNHLGRLAGMLRLLGFDATYRNDLQDEELACISYKEGRILLLRDRLLLMRKIVAQGYLVRSLAPREQVVEVLTRYNLFAHIVPFGRCANCNGLLEEVEKAEILELLQPKTRLYYDEFPRCTGCGQVYWKGSHYENIVEFIEEIRFGRMKNFLPYFQFYNGR
jgi:uncharacterized protein